MGRKVVLEAGGVEEILRLRAEVDEKGKRVWTYGDIAKALGVSLTTVFRAAEGREAYVEGKKEEREKPKLESQTKARKEQREEFKLLMERMEEVGGLSDESALYLIELRQRMEEAGVLE